MRKSVHRKLVRRHNKEHCILILCGEGEGDKHLHEVVKFDTIENLCCMITELQDSKLLPRISGVDLMAAEAKYHIKCMADLQTVIEDTFRKNDKNRTIKKKRKSKNLRPLLSSLNTSNTLLVMIN